MSRPTQVSSKQWRPASSVLPPIRETTRVNPEHLPPAGIRDSASLHLSSRPSVSVPTPSATTSSDSYIRHNVQRKPPLTRPNFESSKVSGLGYAVVGLSETTGWTTIKQSSIDKRLSTVSERAIVSRERAFAGEALRQTPKMWETEAQRSYGNADELSTQCRDRRRELSKQAAVKKDTISRIQFA